MINLASLSERKEFLDKIEDGPNRRRKEESIKRFDVYSERQGGYIEAKLREEFDPSTVDKMRKFKSINLCPKIIKELSAVYKEEPVRAFSLDRRDLNENQQKQIDNLYKYSKFDTKIKRANRFYKLHSQGTIQVVPQDGVLSLRVLQPHQYDVIESDENPERAMAYVVSAPFQKEETAKYLWWSAEYNFITDRGGNILSEVTENPFKVLPFVDFSIEKDFEYWIKNGSNVVEFALEFAVLLSDTANINRLQGYSQAIITSVNKPSNISVGPQKVLYLALDPDRPDTRPTFEFSTPSPDMSASLSLLETYLKLFLSSSGVDSDAISAKETGSRYASGIDRLLAMVESFDTSLDDLDLFRGIEEELFSLMTKISNSYQGSLSSPLIDALKISEIPEETQMTVQFSEPTMIQSISEQEDSVIKRLRNKLIPYKKALMKLYDLDELGAEKMKREIEGDPWEIKNLDSTENISKGD